MEPIKLLRPKKVEQNRLIMVESRRGCFYRYLIFVDENLDFRKEQSITYSEFDYTTWKAAQSAAIKHIRNEIGK